MSRTGVRRRRAGILLIGVGLVACLTGPATSAFGSSEDRRPTGSHRHLVESGDTLWGIARHEAGASEDPRPLIEAIVDANRLQGGRIVVGQQLVIPENA
jgi:nucleoid-associated protein YgaU